MRTHPALEVPDEDLKIVHRDNSITLFGNGAEICGVQCTCPFLGVCTHNGLIYAARKDGIHIYTVTDRADKHTCKHTQKPAYKHVGMHLKHTGCIYHKTVIFALAIPGRFLIREHGDSIRDILYLLPNITNPLIVASCPVMSPLPLPRDMAVKKDVTSLYYDSYTLEVNPDASIYKREPDTSYASLSLFLDKRNILDVSRQQDKHRVIAMQKELLMLGKEQVLDVNTKIRSIEIICEESAYYVTQDFYSFKVQKRDRKCGSKKEHDAVFSCILDNSQIIITEAGREKARILSETLCVSQNGNRIYQIQPNGTLNVFVIDGVQVQHIHQIQGIDTHELAAVQGMCSSFGTVLVLLYTNRSVVKEYAVSIRTKILEKTVVPADARIVSLQRFRREAVCQLCTSTGITAVRYTLGKNKEIVSSVISALPGDTVYIGLSAHNQNVPQVLITVNREEEKYILRINGNSICTDNLIGECHLLHEGYIYSKGSDLVFSDGRVHRMDSCIDRMAVYNSVDRSSVAVSLKNGTVIFLCITRGEIEIKSRAFEILYPYALYVISDTRVCVTFGCSVVLFQSGEPYLFPLLRRVFLFPVLSVLCTPDIMCVTLANGEALGMKLAI